MKYIKLYELFTFTNNVDDEDISEKELTMREICLELEDYGSNIHIHRHGGKFGKLIVINNLDNVLPDLMKECLFRLKEFLGDDFIDLEYWSNDDNPYRNGYWTKFEISEYSKLKTYSIKIGYK